jgi:hypothetical protein
VTRRGGLESFAQDGVGSAVHQQPSKHTAFVGEITMTVAVEARKPMHDAHRVAVDGAVDADGHILEPPDLWETYIDPKFRDRALRIRVDEDGLEELFGRVSVWGDAPTRTNQIA